jgi:cation transport regulator ChaB
MADARRSSPTELLRNLTLSLERLATQGAAGGVVHGVAEGLRRELPDDVEAQLRQLAQDALTVLGRMAQRAAEREAPFAEEAAHGIAAAATRGALGELEREWQDGGMPLHAFAQRLNRLLDHVEDYTGSRRDALRSPDAIAGGVVKGATRQLQEDLPELVERLRPLAPIGAEIAEQVGRGLVAGVQARLGESPAALTGLLERAGEDLARGLVRGLAAGLREELLPREGAPALGARVEQLAERTAAATVRGARKALPTAADVGAAGGALARDVLAVLRRPLLTAAGVAGALLTLGLAARLRRA